MKKQIEIGFVVLVCSISAGLVRAEAKVKNAAASKENRLPAAVYEIQIKRDIDYLGPQRTEKLDLYMPRTADKQQRYPGIVIIHGGGWRWGDKDRPRQQNMGITLAQYGYVCVSINYALADANRPGWPQSIYDCKAAVQFLRKNAESYNVEPNHIGVIGGSAGGHLTAMVGLVGAEEGLEPKGMYEGVSSRVQAAVPFYGVFDLGVFDGTDDDKKRVIAYLGTEREKDPKLWELAAPINHIDKDDPPFLIVHGTGDKIVSYKQSVRLHKKLQEKGVASELLLIEGAPHSFALQPKQKDIRPLVIGFFDKHLKGK